MQRQKGCKAEQKLNGYYLEVLESSRGFSGTRKRQSALLKLPGWSISQAALWLPSRWQRPSPLEALHSRKNLGSSRLSDFISHLIEWEPRATQSRLHKLSRATACRTKSERYFPLQQVLPQKDHEPHTEPCSPNRCWWPSRPPAWNWEPCVIIGLPLWAHQPSSSSGSFPRG